MSELPELENIKQSQFNIAEKLLFLYIILIPIMKVPTLPLLVHKIQYSDLIFPIVLGIWIVRLLQKRCYIKVDRFDFFIIILLILFSISLVLSPERLRSGIEYVGILYLFCVYYLFKQLVLEKSTWWRLIKLSAIVGLVVSLIGIGGYLGMVFTGSPNPFIKEDLFFSSFLGYRAISTFRNANMLASYLHIALVLGFRVGRSPAFRGLVRVRCRSRGIDIQQHALDELDVLLYLFIHDFESRRACFGHSSAYTFIADGQK